MLIIGGIYEEICAAPEWNQIFGSAGRAACAIYAIFKSRVKLVGCYSKANYEALKACFAPYHVDLDIKLGKGHVVFEYVHPLARPKCYATGMYLSASTISASANLVLFFGMMEGIPRISANTLIIDPQGRKLTELLRSDFIKARRIAIVANLDEISEQPNLRVDGNVRELFRIRDSIDLIIVKMGIEGALLFSRNRKKPLRILPYQSNKIFKIGSGDIFSATFAHAWGKLAMNPAQAADMASRAVAFYVNDPYLNFNRKTLRKAKPIKRVRKSGRVYLAAPFFTLADKSVLNEARSALASLGIKVFSPYHHVGLATSSEIKRVAIADLKGLRKSRCVLALLHNNDLGSVFEVGYARARNIPVVILADRSNREDLTMLIGTDCEITRDISTAVYKTAWIARS
jgi:nucleoside 2-deoxyribosyltransferase